MGLIDSFTGRARARGRSVRGARAWKLGVFDHQLEGRVTPATLTTFQFQIPAAVANMGVQIGLFGNQPLAQGQTLNTQEFLAQTGPGTYAYQNVGTSGQLPLITLASPSTTNTQPVSVNIPIPQDALLSGAAVMFVGPNKGPTILTDPNSYTGGFVAVPTTATNPNDVFSLFELTNVEVSAGQFSLDVDISEVDQLGFTYTVTSSNSAPFPLSQVGTSPTRETFFTQYKNAFSTTNTAFLESLTLGQNSDGDQLRLVAPQTILGTFQSSGPSLISAGTQGTGGNGGLVQGTAYYYLITAKSATGETIPSANIAYAGGVVNATTSVVLNWQAYTGIQSATGQNNPFVSGSSETTGYNIYRGIGQAPDGSGAHPPALSAFQLVDTVAGANTTTYTDIGKASAAPAPPTNSYGFDPLSTYFTSTIQDFFTYYATHDFVYTQYPQAPGFANTVFTGRTATFVPDWVPAGSNLTYTALRLTGAGGEFDGVTFNIYQPLFSTNTNLPGLPPAPSWLPSASESPAQMVFGCDGVFATNTSDPDVQSITSKFPNVPVGDAQKSIGNIENVIVSAFNRGLATLSPNLQPDQWVNPLQFTSNPTPVAGGSLTANQPYYYVITSVLPSGGETVPTREIVATPGAGQGSLTLTWAPLEPSVASAYRIYRGTSTGQEVLITTVQNVGTPQPTTFTDMGGQAPSTTTPPFRFYTPGVVSNLYSAFLHQNSTTDPANGISVNGLVYGFPFDDQGNFSTNIQYPTGNLPTTVTFTLNDFTNAPAPIQTGAIAGRSFSATFTGQTGDTVHFTSTDPKATLPADYTFQASDNGSRSFDFTLVQAGTQTITAVVSGNNPIQTAIVTVKASAATRLTFSTLPQGQVFARSFFQAAVTATDPFGNLADTTNGVVTLTSPGLKVPLRVTLHNGVATFVVSLPKGGRFPLTASNEFGSTTSGPIFVSTATRLAIAGRSSGVTGQSLPFQITARTRAGMLDRNYQGRVNVYIGDRLLATGVAVNGVIKLNLTLPFTPGRTKIFFRDSLNATLLGWKTVKIRTP